MNQVISSSLFLSRSILIVTFFAGVKLGRQIEKLGMHSSDTAEIFFDDVRVPSRNIIGEEGRGFVYQMAQFQDERLVAVAVCKFKKYANLRKK